MPPSRRIRFAIVRCAVLSLLLWTQIAPAQIRDGGINPANLGKGDWIYILANAVNHLGGNSPAVTNLASLMAYEKNQGVQYLIIKAGDGPTKFPSDVAPQFTAEVVDAGHAAGLKIFGYDRSAGIDQYIELGKVAVDETDTQHAHHLLHQRLVVRPCGLS